MNGTMERPSNLPHTSQKLARNYKLLVDPFLVKGATKLYRYDGNVPSDPTCPPVTPRDPRSHISKLWNRIETPDLVVPR